MNDQRSVKEQLNSLMQLAIEAGLYDAADWLRAELDHQERLKTIPKPEPADIRKTHTIAEHVHADPVEVRWDSLESVSDHKLRKWCSKCNKGILLVTRHRETLQLSRYDRCTHCGQLFKYLEDEISGERVYDYPE